MTRMLYRVNALVAIDALGAEDTSELALEQKVIEQLEELIPLQVAEISVIEVPEEYVLHPVPVEVELEINRNYISHDVGWLSGFADRAAAE